MTYQLHNDRIPLVADRAVRGTMERYRSGHNEAVLKTVCPQGRVGSNPTLSVSENEIQDLRIYIRYLNQAVEKYPRG